MPSPALLPTLPLLLPPLLVAQDGGGAPAAGGGGIDMFVLLLVPLAIFWFVAIWPERKAKKKKEALLAAIKKNDRVLLNGGMYATIAAVSEKDLTVRFDDGPTRVRVLRSAIATVLTPGESGETAKEG